MSAKITKNSRKAPPGKALDEPAPAAFADLPEAMAYLGQRLNLEALRPAQVDRQRIFNLSRMIALMDRLDNPQESIKVVHVAGSKGKGSVCEMTASCLTACGYAVGLYTSPHMVDLAERIRIDNRPISAPELAAAVSRVARAAERLPKAAGDPTHFEFLTAAAFVHFADMAVDLAVIETGLGGRLDATNFVKPEVTAVTAIQKEHTLFLGSTLQEIAREKAGIFKKGAPALTFDQAPEVLDALREAAHAAGTTLRVVGKDIEYSHRFEAAGDGPRMKVVLTTQRSSFEHLPVPLRGEHQAPNCGLALAIIDALRSRGLHTPEAMVARGLAATPPNGRMELIHQAPRIIADGAHNGESVKALVKAVGAQLRTDSIVVVFGCAADKDIPGMLAAIATGADKIIFTRAADNPRAADPRDLARRFAEVSHKMCQVAPSVKDALNTAARATGPRGDLILVTGSFAVAGEAKRLLLAKHREPARPPEVQLREVKPSAIAPRRKKR